MARRPRPRIVKLKAPQGDTQLADTLLFMLSRVRQGRLKAISISMILIDSDGYEQTVEMAGADGDDGYEIQLLGCMRAAENGLLNRRAARKANVQVT